MSSALADGFLTTGPPGKSQNVLLKSVSISPLLLHTASSFTYSNMQLLLWSAVDTFPGCPLLSHLMHHYLTSLFPDTSFFSQHLENPDLVSDARPSLWLAPLPAKCFPWSLTWLAPEHHSVLQPSVPSSERLPMSTLCETAPPAGLLFLLILPLCKHALTVCYRVSQLQHSLCFRLGFSVLWSGRGCPVHCEMLSSITGLYSLAARSTPSQP